MTSQEISALVPQFVVEYESGKTYQEIANQFGLGTTCIRNRLASVGVKSRQAIRSREIKSHESVGKKKCSKCGEIKDLAQFRVRPYHKEMRDSWCNPCHNADRRGRWKKYPGRYSKVRSANYYANQQKNIERARSYREAHMQGRKARERFRMYGITDSQYTDLITLQKGRCAVCGSYNPRGKHRSWCVDHNHKTGEVRGLLCTPCNVMLGQCGDNPTVLAAGIRYLAVPPARAVLFKSVPGVITSVSVMTSEMETLQ